MVLCSHLLPSQKCFTRTSCVGQLSPLLQSTCQPKGVRLAVDGPCRVEFDISERAVRCSLVQQLRLPQQRIDVEPVVKRSDGLQGPVRAIPPETYQPAAALKAWVRLGLARGSTEEVGEWPSVFKHLAALKGVFNSERRQAPLAFELEPEGAKRCAYRLRRLAGNLQYAVYTQ